MEYRHSYSRSGGAQYCIAPTAERDIIVVYAEAFERNADPDDFSLEALIAHECGHQRLIRDPSLRKILAEHANEIIEEVLASLVGSLLLGKSKHAQALVWKATAELSQLGLDAARTVEFVERIRRDLREFVG